MKPNKQRLQYEEFPKTLYNAAGEGKVANSLGEEAALEARGYRGSQDIGIKASKLEFERVTGGGPPLSYKPEPYPKWIEAPGHEPVVVADAEAETRIRRSWGEVLPEPEELPLSAEYADFLAWRAAQSAKGPQARKRPAAAPK
jgi:hypothetical protein